MGATERMSLSLQTRAGVELGVLGRHAEAQTLLARAVERDPADLDARFGLAEARLGLRDLRGAAEAARAALAIAPDDSRWPGLSRTLGMALYTAGLWEDAEPWLSRAEAGQPWDVALAATRRRVRLPPYLAPWTTAEQTGTPLRRYAAREGDSYIFAIDIVGTCNLRCPTCPVGNSPARPRGFMPLEMFRAIVDKIARECPAPHPQINLFNWGEPLLHPDLPAFIEILRAAGMRSHLSTNLNIRRGLAAAIAADPDDLKISLSGFSQATYARAHARGNIELVKANMRLLRAHADRHGARTHIWVGHHIYRSNQQDIEPLRAFCAELGFAYSPIAAFYMPLERLIEVLGGKPNPADGGIVDDLLHDPAERRRQAAANRSGRFDCELRFNQTVINHDGTVALCCTVYDRPNMLGVSFLDEPMADIDARKYRHPFCNVCIRNKVEYAPAELEPGAPFTGLP